MKNARAYQQEQRLYSLIDSAVKQTKQPLLDQATASAMKTSLHLSPDQNSIQYIIESMLSKSTDLTIRLSPNLAARIIAEASFPRQRTLKQYRINKNKELIANNQWRGPDFPIHFARIPPRHGAPGKFYLLNGHHRVQTISELDTSIPIMVKIADVATEDEAAVMYASFDNPSDVRTDIEILKAYGIEALKELPNGIITSAYRALIYLRNDLEPAHAQSDATTMARDRDGRIRALQQWTEQTKAYWRDIKHAPHWLKIKLLGSGVTAVALYTYRYQPRLAHEFWFGIANNDGLVKGDPRNTLINDFGNRTAGKSGASRVNLQAVALAWNAFCEKRDLLIIKCYPDAPIKVWGTPFASGNRKQA